MHYCARTSSDNITVIIRQKKKKWTCIAKRVGAHRKKKKKKKLSNKKNFFFFLKAHPRKIMFYIYICIYITYIHFMPLYILPTCTNVCTSLDLFFFLLSGLLYTRIKCRRDTHIFFIESKTNDRFFFLFQTIIIYCQVYPARKIKIKYPNMTHSTGHRRRRVTVVYMMCLRCIKH